jgi:CheY-like chemotaxis protein
VVALRYNGVDETSKYRYIWRAHRGQVIRGRVRGIEKIKVVIVDDDPAILELLEMWLGMEWGLDVATFTTYAEAEACIRESDVWIVLFDYFVRTGTGSQHFALDARSFFNKIKGLLKERNGTGILMSGDITGASLDFPEDVRDGSLLVLPKPWGGMEDGITPILAKAARRKWRGERRDIKQRLETLQGVLQTRLFDALKAHPDPVTPKEAALENRWKSRTAWKELFEDAEDNDS